MWLSSPPAENQRGPSRTGQLLSTLLHMCPRFLEKQLSMVDSLLVPSPLFLLPPVFLLLVLLPSSDLPHLSDLLPSAHLHLLGRPHPTCWETLLHWGCPCPPSAAMTCASRRRSTWGQTDTSAAARCSGSIQGSVPTLSRKSTQGSQIWTGGWLAGRARRGWIRRV